MNKKDIQDLFESFTKKKVLIIGDLMIDAYLWGGVSRISPEAPVPVVELNKRENRLGGSANVALNIQSLGAEPILCSVIGNGDWSATVFDLLKKRNMTNIGILKDNSRKTTIKFRIISCGQHLLRVDEERTNQLEKEIEEKFIKKIISVIEENSIDAIIFEDYDKGVIGKNLITEIVEAANGRNIPTLVDPKKRNFNHYKNVSLFKPNLKELIEGLKLEVDKNDNNMLFEISKKYIEKTNNKYVMTTLSEAGIFISDSEKFYHVPAEHRDIIDVSGAGDTVIATSALCLINDLGIKHIAKIANIAGGIVCEKVGVVPVKRDILKKEIVKIYKIQ